MAERLTTDNPKNNTETMLNYAYVKDKQVILRYGDGKENINLCEYISRLATDKSCHPTPEEVLDGECMECDCELAILYWVAVQAAELRGRLAAYEDLGSVEELAEMKQEINIIKNTEPIELGMAKLKLGLLQQQIADGKLVEVVRCGECKYQYYDDVKLCKATDNYRVALDDDYCKYGERRGNNGML